MNKHKFKTRDDIDWMKEINFNLPLLLFEPNTIVLHGSIKNGFLEFPDGRVLFLPYDPMRPFRSKGEIEKEITLLLKEREEQS